MPRTMRFVSSRVLYAALRPFVPAEFVRVGFWTGPGLFLFGRRVLVIAA